MGGEKEGSRNREKVRSKERMEENKWRGIMEGKKQNENMDARDMILDDITRKQLIWHGHVERMVPTRLPKIMFHWKPEGRKKRGRPRRTWKDGIYTAINESDLRMGEWNN